MENNENIALSEETAAPCGADTKRSFGNIVKHYADRYFIKALGAMAKGLFASLLIGTIIAQFARIPALSGILDPIVKVAQNGFVVGGAIWYPFFKAYEKQCIDEETATEAAAE